jgi:hypothetical protein
MKPLTFIVFLMMILTACGSSKKTTVQLAPKPAWVDDRPINRQYYIGIGVSRKWGSPANFQSDARQKAMSDMAAQISSSISSTAILHQVENKQGVSEMLASQIKVSSQEFLEGYEMVGEWQDETNYYVYYQLSKQQFAELKEQRRIKAMDVASARFANAQSLEASHQTLNAITVYASTIEALKDYLGDNNIKDTPEGSVDLAIESLKNIKKLINSLKITAATETINTKPLQMISEAQLTFTVQSEDRQPQANIPVSFIYSAGFLRTDNISTNAQGQAATAIHQVNNGQKTQTLCARIDVARLSRMLTQDLLIRKLIEGTVGNSACVAIYIE